MMKRHLYPIIILLFLSLPHILVFQKWFQTSEMPDVYEGLSEFSNLSFVKQFFVEFGHIPLWCSWRNSGMPLTFFLLPGWWVWSSPLIALTLVFDEIIASKIVFSLFTALSSLSMYIYALRLTRHKVGSILAGWIYSSSGTFLTIGLTHFHTNFAIFWALIPLVFLSLDEMFMNQFSFLSTSKAALISWGAFSSQPLFFIMSFVPFMGARALFLINTKAVSGQGKPVKKALLKISMFTFLFFFLNLWWIIPQLSYQTLYLTPVYVDPSAIFSAYKPLSTHTFSEVVSMQTFAGGGTEFLKDPGISGLRSFGFFLPFSFSFMAPIVCRRNKREVLYLFSCFFLMFLLFMLLALFEAPFLNKVAPQPFFTSCLSAFTLRGLFGRFSGRSTQNDVLNRPLLNGFKRKGLSILLLISVSTLVLSSGFVEMYRLTETYDPPEELDEAYAFLSTLTNNERIMILNVPFITPIGKPYYSSFKPENFIGYYYSYLADYETVTHGMRNSYGPINEYEPNKYVSSTFRLLDDALKHGHYGDFLALLNFLPNLSHMVVYRDLVSEDVISLFEDDTKFRPIYENSLILVFESLKSGELARTRITDAPMIVSTSNIGSGMMTLGCLLHDLETNVLPIVLFNETSSQMEGLSIRILNEKVGSWVFEAEDLLSRSDGVFVSESFNYTNLSPSNGKSVAIRNGGFANISLNLGEKNDYSLSFRIFHSNVPGGGLFFYLDGQRLGGYETSSVKSRWEWINFTATLEQGRHEIQILNVDNATSVEYLDILTVSTENYWDKLLLDSLRRTSVAVSETDGYDAVVHVPSDVGSPSILVFDEAYFPSWRLLMDNQECLPIVVNAFSTGFAIDRSPSNEVLIKFTLSLEEKVAFLSPFAVLFIMGLLFFHRILGRIRNAKDNSMHA